MYKAIKFKTNIGARISEEAKNKNIHLEELSDKSKISIPCIRAICMGRCYPKVETMELLADALKIPPEYLIWGIKVEERFNEYKNK